MTKEKLWATIDLYKRAKGGEESRATHAALDTAIDAVYARIAELEADLETTNGFCEKHRAERDTLRAKLEELEKQKPFCMHWVDRWGCNHYADPKESIGANAQPLYLAAKPTMLELNDARLTALNDIAALATVGATYPELMEYLQSEIALAEAARSAK